MDFRVLGPLWVGQKGKEVTPSAPKVRQVLAFLLVRRGSFVQVDEFIDELWGQQAPNSAMTTLQTYIYKLRKDVLEHAHLAKLHTKVSGYLLDVPAEASDLFRFEQLSQQGQLALEKGDSRRAGTMLSAALAEWRGAALADVSQGEILSANVTRLEESRMRALDLRIEADLALGRHLELISELKALVQVYPLHERFYGHLMLALHRSGRRYEALEVYQNLRRTLVDELGLEPSAQVSRLHMALLGNDPAVDTSPDLHVPGHAGTTGQVAFSVAHANGNGHGPDGVVSRENGHRPYSGRAAMGPCQIPADITDFTGRAQILSDLRQHLSAPAEAHATPRVASISGMAGVGKTALAVRAAHLERAAYLDGLLYADLKGSSAAPADPHDVLAEFAEAVGCPPHRLPSSMEERSQEFRERLSGRRMLIMLDDAASAAQVMPLLPGSAESAAVITSRSGLYGMPGLHLELRVMEPGEGIVLLARLAGQERTRQEPAAAEKIVRLCSRLPLAIRCAGSRLAAMRSWPLEGMATQLEGPNRLDLLSFGDLDVRNRYDAGYERLDLQDQGVFRLISLLPSADFTSTVAAGLLGISPDSMEVRLLRLVGAHFLEIDKTVDGELRYRMHDLVRIYARERLDKEFMAPAASHSPAPRQPSPRRPAPPDPPAERDRLRTDNGMFRPHQTPAASPPPLVADHELL